MTNITIDSASARELVQKAIFESLDQASRDALIQQAVAHLTKRPKRGPYSNEEEASPLEYAFERAVNDISQAVVREYLSDEKIKQGIQDQIEKALGAIINEKGTWIYDQIGYAVGQKIARVLGGEDS